MNRWKEIQNLYLNELFTSVMPFWVQHGLDKEKGGFYGVLDQKGDPLSTDKGGWVHGRVTWIFSYLYKYLDKDKKWYDLAEHSALFLRDHMRNSEGRIYFEVDREGNPLILRRYLFSEVFAAIGFAGFYQICGDRKWLSLALQTLKVIEKFNGKLPEKIDSGTRPIIGHSWTMILISLYQILRESDTERTLDYDRLIDKQIEDIFKYFVKDDMQVLLETTAPDGSITEGPEGRCVNPGHAIETAWFILQEAKYRDDKDLMKRILPVLDWSIQKGWDQEYGGLFSFIDSEGRQPVQVEWDMKYWWPHTEALYATLLAYQITGEQRYKKWFEIIHEYTWSHFPDRVYGEWFGYLHRDGSIANTVKGNNYKGPFHIPRCLMMVGRLAGEMDKEGFR